MNPDQEALDLIIKECDKVLSTLSPVQKEKVDEKVKQTLKNIKPKK